MSPFTLWSLHCFIKLAEIKVVLIHPLFFVCHSDLFGIFPCFKKDSRQAGMTIITTLTLPCFHSEIVQARLRYCDKIKKIVDKLSGHNVIFYWNDKCYIL
jgi:hypothetical protein